MIHFATIGTNFITKWFLEAAKECPILEYQAVYSRNEDTAKAFAREFGAKTYVTDIEELARMESVDGVYIASPNSLHYEQAMLLMEHGKHILCEKTIASNSQELKSMLELAEKKHVVLLEAMRSVFDPGFYAISENLHKLGTIRRASFQFCKYSSRYDNFKNGIVENAFNPELSNGALMDIGVYCVHPMMKLFGRPKSVHGEALMLRNGIDGSGTILAEYEGMHAEMIYSKISNSQVPSQIQGEDGCMIIRAIENPKELFITYNNGETEKILVEKKDQNMVYETAEWARLIENGLTGREHNRYSVMALEVMDQVRAQTGLVFPADKRLFSAKTGESDNFTE